MGCQCLAIVELTPVDDRFWSLTFPLKSLRPDKSLGVSRWQGMRNGQAWHQGEFDQIFTV